ncbi:MAG: hypothetical protein DMF11_07150 [Verrucomicrobia bacterium]|nr:MAG: hypothetical protein DMF11_07150 [Verrucomicrobiota bacterium]
MVIEPQHPLRKVAFGSEMGLPLASHTVNFTGMVLSLLLLNTLLPSVLIGGKMTPPGGFCPVHVPYTTVKDAVPLLGEYELSPAKLAPTPDG